MSCKLNELRVQEHTTHEKDAKDPCSTQEKSSENQEAREIRG